jgi:hypothetical protein
MLDFWKWRDRDVTDPASNAAAVTPGAAALPVVTRAIYSALGGNVRVTMAGFPGSPGNTLTLALPAGVLLPIRVTHVLAPDTTVTDLVAFW